MLVGMVRIERLRSKLLVEYSISDCRNRLARRPKDDLRCEFLQALCSTRTVVPRSGHEGPETDHQGEVVRESDAIVLTGDRERAAIFTRTSDPWRACAVL